MSMTQAAAASNTLFQQHIDDLRAYVHQAARCGTAIHQVEEHVFRCVLQLGKAALTLFLTTLGTGDQGPTVTLPDGSTCQRLEATHPRLYKTIFGPFQLQRTVYGSREGQKLDFVPLDNRLQLPAGEFSYLLQDWDQVFCQEQAFGQANSSVQRIFQLVQSVASLEHMNVAMAEWVDEFRDNQPRPDPASEGELFVLSADGKGIVMRRTAEDPAPAAYRTKGEKASQKQMATVAAAYTIDRYARTPEDVVAALFHDRHPTAPRPRPCHKRVLAKLTLADEHGQTQHGQERAFEWLLNEAAERNRDFAKETVHLFDGQESLWDRGRAWLPRRNSTEILDLLHVTPRLWEAAHLFQAEKSSAAEQFVREKLLRVLRGEVSVVVTELRHLGREQALKGSKKQRLKKVCDYLDKNRKRMRYGDYLQKGYPIASGVIEGACRHLVKDRMERAGMHWTPAGAQAMLDVRSTYINGDWDEYQKYRIARETQRLYPHRHLVEGPLFTMAV